MILIQLVLTPNGIVPYPRNFAGEAEGVSRRTDCRVAGFIFIFGISTVFETMQHLLQDWDLKLRYLPPCRLLKSIDTTLSSMNAIYTKLTTCQSDIISGEKKDRRGSSKMFRLAINGSSSIGSSSSPETLAVMWRLPSGHPSSSAPSTMSRCTTSCKGARY